MNKKYFLNSKIIAIVIVFIIVFLNCKVSAQQALLSSGGNTTNGNISFSFGQFAYQTYFEAKSSVAQGVQHPFETEPVPSLASVLDTTVKTGEINCFNALQNITVAGNGHLVTIQNNGVADFIAGRSVTFLPGFYAQSGSLVRAYITTDNTFCDGIIQSSIVQLPPEEKSQDIMDDDSPDIGISSQMQVKVYPNPNNGNFKIGLIHFESNTTVRIYNVLGAVLYSSTLNPTLQNEVINASLRSGIYFVEVISNNKKFIKKIIVN